MLLYHQHVLHVIVSLLRLFLDLFYCVSLLVTLSMTMSSHQKELVNEVSLPHGCSNFQ